MASKSPVPLGRFGKLPLELRREIFRLLLPASFRQVYAITKVGLIYVRELSSPKPQFLQATKQLREEMLQSMVADGICKVRIDLATITTNSVDLFWANNNSAHRKIFFKVPPCTLLEMSIVPPFPRTAEDFAQVRKNVQVFVETLNNSTCDIIPKMSVKLEHQESGGGFQCGVNDFAMLMGPFSRLKKQCRAVMIYRTTWWYSFAPKIEQQCNLIESAISGSHESKKLFTFQQRIIDIKLPLCLFEAEEKRLTFRAWPSSRPRGNMDIKTIGLVMSAC